jgi:putative membrane protein
MIVRKRLSVRRVLYYTGKETAIFAGVAFLVTLAYFWCQPRFQFFVMEPAPLTLIGSALSIFLGFRTNSAYQRWWEGRILWGGIVNQSRNFARQILSFTDGSANREQVETFEREMVYYQIAFVHATRCHLRRQDPFEEIAPFLPSRVLNDLHTEQNVPAALLHRMAMRLKAAHHSGWFDTLRFISLSDTLNELTNLLGGCERIKNTTLPRQYDVFPRLFVWIFNTLLPFGLVKSLHWYTVPVCTVIAFIFIALDVIGANIENPFENTIHDTPMTSLSRTIEINLRQMLGEKELPPKVEPVDGYLY